MSQVTILLDAIRNGDSEAQAKLWTLVYEDLRNLARSKMAQEKPGQTLQATALVHEVWLRLGGKEELLRNSSHFFAVAATAMRRILVDIARKKARVRHGGGQKPISIEEIDVAGFETPSETILAVDEALKKLELEDPESAKVAELRYFIGMTIPEVAKAMGISEKTVKRRWEFARVFLFKELSGE